MPVFIKDLAKYLAGDPRKEEILEQAKKEATPKNGILSARAVYELLGPEKARNFFRPTLAGEEKVE